MTSHYNPRCLHSRHVHWRSGRRCLSLVSFDGTKMLVRTFRSLNDKAFALRRCPCFVAHFLSITSSCIVFLISSNEKALESGLSLLDRTGLLMCLLLWKNCMDYPPLMNTRVWWCLCSQDHTEFDLGINVYDLRLIYVTVKIRRKRKVWGMRNTYQCPAFHRWWVRHGPCLKRFGLVAVIVIRVFFGNRLEEMFQCLNYPGPLVTTNSPQSTLDYYSYISFSSTQAKLLSHVLIRILVVSTV